MMPFRAASDVEPGSVQLAVGCNLMQCAGTHLTESKLHVIEFPCLCCQNHEGLPICFAFLRRSEVERRHSHQCRSIYGHFLLKQIGLISDKTAETSVAAA